MSIALVTTLQPLRAHMAAGVLREYGIFAWVAGDLGSSGYGPMTTGACRVMVNDEDVDAATQILQAQPEPVEPSGTGEKPDRQRVSLSGAVATGMVHGLIGLPLLLVFFWLLLSALAVFRLCPQAWSVLQLSKESLVQAGLYGLVVGFAGGVGAWFISDYKHSGFAGVIFAVLLAILLVFISAAF